MQPSFLTLFYTLHIHSLDLKGVGHHNFGPILGFSKKINFESTYLRPSEFRNQLLFYGTLNQSATALNTFESGYIRFTGNLAEIDIEFYKFDLKLQKLVVLGHGGLMNYTLEMTII